MKTLKRYRTAWRRYCRSHGFGIHSPFAYNFVTEVMHQRLPYYAYEEIEALRKSLLTAKLTARKRKRVMSLKHAKLIFRITNHFNPMHILQIGSNYGLTAATVMMVNSRSTLWLYEPNQAHSSGMASVLLPFEKRICRLQSIVHAVTDYPEATANAAQQPFVIINNIPDAEGYSQLQYYVTSVLLSQGVIIFRNIATDPLTQQLWNESKQYAQNNGMTFSNHRIAVFVASPKLPRQDFTLWL
ncbi:MAG: hypothetical protein ACI308_00680 [Muribaculaceae bacterium]